jgi:RHS repeat-associated protein
MTRQSTESNGPTRATDARRTKHATRALAAFLAAVVFLTLGTPLAADAQDTETLPPSASGPTFSVVREELAAQVEAAVADELAHEASEQLQSDFTNDPRLREALESGEAGDAPAEIPEGAEATALPSGEAKSAVEPTRISLPNAEGSIEGMGESFAPVLSSGTATFSVPIALPAGRAGVQPSLGLSYASTNGNGPLGIGWNLSTPFIVRQSDRGLPRYLDDTRWHPDEDRFFYNGGQELVPVDDATIAAIDGSGRYPNVAGRPAEVNGWQQYRARVEGGFLRFFRSPDRTRWIVQGKDGTRFDFGLLPSGEGPSDLEDTVAVQSESPGGVGRIYGWHLTRMSDPHGSTVYYRYVRDAGEVYVADVYYLSPNDCAGGDVASRRGCSAPLESYGVRAHFDYENREDVTSRYTSGWRVETRLRLRRVTVTAMDMEGVERQLVRRYHLGYAPSSESFHSLLTSVQVEGRPDEERNAGGVMAHHVFTNVSEAAVIGDALDRTRGRLLPPMTFGYTEPPRGSSGGIPGFGGIDETVRTVEAPPNVSVDAARADLFDVNSDGLPDLIVTDPARYRTESGAPAVGVFFNGFSGPSAEPAGRTAIFSAPVAVPMRSDLSGTLNLGNANVVPMDVDGDGRSDLLHMPRLDRYGFFTPTRASDEAAGHSPSPADQGWRFTYAEVQLERGTDPRVDLVRDGSHYEMFDVNGDHLVDVVRTTGTAMQTWLNLGWLPGGEGKFGQVIRTGPGVDDFRLSSEPHETCLLHDGLPVDFADPEVRLADMNGDGLTDLVKMRRGRVVWWPGRGVNEDGAPVFGDGPTECGRGQGGNRHRVMANPPMELNPDLSGVYLSDVNADGAPDLVQVRFREVDVWFNRAGEGFTARTIARSPMAPDFAPRLRFADIDGSATLDLVYGSASRWEYLDFMGGERPRVLSRVENGLGATTTMAYDSSSTDYVEDLAEASDDSGTGRRGVGETFTWSHVDGDCDQLLQELSGECVYRSGGSPVISRVVRSVSTTDNFDRLGREANVVTTRFAYHDGYYEGIEQEFRGFGAADAVAEGDAAHPSAYTRTYFHQGRRPQSIATDRLAENPYEALKGRQWLSEVFGEGGLFLSSAHATIALRRLAVGLDGRFLWYAYVSQSDELRYDTSVVPNEPNGTSLAGPGGMLELPSVVHQELDANALLVVRDTENTTIAIRATGHAHLRSTTDEVDNLGQVITQRAHGRPGVEEVITSHARPVLLGDGSGWLWRTDETYVTGTASATRYGWSTSRFDESTGDLLWSAQLAQWSGPAYAFAGDAQGAQGFTIAAAYGETDAAFGGATGQVLEASTSYDAWGNPLASCAGEDLQSAGASACWRYAEVTYDETYAQLPVREAIAVHGGSASYCDTSTNGLCMMSTTAVWDRGMGLLLSSTDANAQVTEVRYSGLGRLAAVVPPRHDGDATECPIGTPAATFRYSLVEGGLPVNYVESAQHPSPTCSGQVDDSLVSRSYVDGLGRARASLERTELGDRGWVQSGVARLTARGTALLAFDPVLLDFDPPSPFDAVGLPTSPYVQATYDAFGQVTQSTERDLSVSRVFYKALETVAADPLDLDLLGGSAVGTTPSSLFEDTYTRSRVDGHGRAIEQVLHQRTPEGEWYERLSTTYRTDGAVLSVTRAQTTGPQLGAPVAASGDRALTRTFTYDTLGRRLGGTDPDSDGRTGTEATQRWRYLYNRVGDLVAMRDPRGCGQNFYYDRAGRLLGEDYVGCEEAQFAGEEPSDSLPSEAIALTLDGTTGSRAVDVRYAFDAEPGWSSFSRPSSFDRGRLVGSSDRGQRSMVAYDNRGRTTWSERQMAVLPAAGAVPMARSGNDPGEYVDDDPPNTSRTFDENHVYTTTANYDRIDRVLGRVWPTDPDWSLMGGTGSAPVVSASMSFNRRGLPTSATLAIDSVTIPVLRSAAYDVFGQSTITEFGTSTFGLSRTDTYDVCRRPTRILWSRTATVGSSTPDLGAVTSVLDEHYAWDAASNLVQVEDLRPSAEWPAEQRPHRYEIRHDALYRVAQVDYSYRSGTAWTTTGNPATDWRATQNAMAAVDPMERRPAPRLGDLPDDRVVNFTYAYDWLANQTEWSDDAGAFYERSLGTQIRNGFAEGETNGGVLRPTALYLASSVPTSAQPPNTSLDRGGWVRVRYGQSGNATSVTVRALCHDVSSATACWDDTNETDVDDRASHLIDVCVCEQEQHYEYRWDELNRLAEARRYDRDGSGDWALQVRQRYRYDAGNIRTLKETVDEQTPNGSGFAQNGVERVALYVMPGDFERRGLVADRLNDEYDASTALGTETQYLVAGARVVWKAGTSGSAFERDARVTLALSNLLQSTSGVVDLVSGELLEVATYYPNGARETLRANDAVEDFTLEPVGFTGKEDDSEVGLVYFGMRYLMPHLGRWASPDPLQIHAGGGGEFGNSYHYVSGNLLQARDPNGLKIERIGGDQYRGTWTDSQGRRQVATGTLGQVLEAARQSGAASHFLDFGVSISRLYNIWREKGVHGLRQILEGIGIRAANGERFDASAIAGALAEQFLSEASALWDARGDAAQTAYAEGRILAGVLLSLVGDRVAAAAMSRVRAVVRPRPPASPAPANPGQGCVGACTPCRCFAAGTVVESGNGETGIENIHVGDTISGAQYGCVDTPEEVYEVKLVARNSDGEIVGMTLLRDREWVDENVQGDVAELDFPEGPRVGPAAVLAVTRASAPARACGLVTGTFQRLAYLTLALVLAGGETLQVTPEHPVYSTDRDGWVAAAEVAAGELLATEDGEIRVLSTTPVVGPVWVHNLEVAGAHEYFVGGARIRAHNDCGNARPASPSGDLSNSGPENRGARSQPSEMLDDDVGERAANARSQPRRVVPDQTVTSHGTIVHQGDVDVGPTLDRVSRGERHAHKNDGSVFQNRAVTRGGAVIAPPQLPSRPAGYYREYVVPTPGVAGPGAQRLVIGRAGEVYYTPNHYQSFVQLR